MAAFAKRGSIDRMDLVPLHLALQKGALAMAVLAMPLVTLINRLFIDVFGEVSILVSMCIQMPLVRRRRISNPRAVAEPPPCQS